MTRGARRVASLAVLLLAACGDDGAAPSDAMVDAPPDARPRGRDAGPPECGNGRIERGESCDDGNLAAGDGCDDACRRGPDCGDGRVDPELGEVCDDGNRTSGDGCAPTCLTREECGDGARDPGPPTGAEEICDDGNADPADGCDCTELAGCGDSVVDAAASETCDDGNAAIWDGCGPDCRREVSLVIQALSIAEPAAGCDWTGDGAPDNRLGLAMGAARPPFNTVVRNRLDSGTGSMLLHLAHLDDPEGIEDGAFRLVWLIGVGTTMDPMDDFTGRGEFRAVNDGWRSTTPPPEPARFLRWTRSVAASVHGSMIEGGPEDFVLRLPLGGPDPAVAYDVPLSRARITAVTETSGGESPRVAAIREGLICGVATLTGFDAIPHPLLPGRLGLRCDGTMGQISFADIAAAGTNVLGIRTRPTQPDVDLDGDGLEVVETLVDGPPECHPIIVGCIDGDGTRIEGETCAGNPAMADGWSSAIHFEAVSARIVGAAIYPEPP
jgi:cysteine-rich repeat protein